MDREPVRQRAISYPPRDPIVPLLLLIATTTGLVDAVSVLGLGLVFCANMTGNIVFLGFALAEIPGFNVAPHVTALAGFIAGATVSGRIGKYYVTRSIDPVARFHLSNGARLERVNWLGNVAPRGIEESYGIMVNYLYDPKTIEANHEAFAHDGMVVCSPEVNALIVPAAPPVGIAADGA